MPTINDRSRDVAPSGIREIVNLKARLGGEFVPLHIGEPDFNAPPHVFAAADAKARSGARYGLSAGEPDLRAALAVKLQQVNSITVQPDDVIVTNGGVQGCAIVLQSLLNPGDEVLVPDPAWPNYVMMIELAGAVAVPYPLPPETGFVPDPAQVEALVTDRTKVLITNSPSNPTGGVFPGEVVEELVRICQRHDLAMLADEVYDQLTFDVPHVSAAPFGPEHVISVFSFSKTYAMTGWRVGYVAAPTWLGPTLWKVQEPALACVSQVNQAAALAALTGPQAIVAEMRDAYRHRRDLVVGLLRAAGFDVGVPAGAFYLMFPLAQGADSRAAALDLLTGERLAVAPGTAFGTVAADHLRLSLASSDEQLRIGIERLVSWYRATDGGLRLERVPASA